VTSQRMWNFWNRNRKTAPSDVTVAIRLKVTADRNHHRVDDGFGL